MPRFFFRSRERWFSSRGVRPRDARALAAARRAHRGSLAMRVLCVSTKAPRGFVTLERARTAPDGVVSEERRRAKKKRVRRARSPVLIPLPASPRAIRWRKRASRPRRCARFPSCRCSARARSSSGARRSIVRSIARGPRAARSASVAPSASPRRQRIHARAVPFFKPSSVALFPRVPVHRAHRPSPPRARPPLASSSRPRTQAPESRARRGGRQGDALPRL